MKCAILLVILMVTVGFIYGTQSDSVLKKVRSVTGNDPRLDKARDGREKYGPFRKHIVPKLMEQANRRDGPLSERSGQVGGYCENKLSLQACALVSKPDNQIRSDYPVFGLTRYCNCISPQSACNEDWEYNNPNTVTVKRVLSSGTTEYQWKFCVTKPPLEFCNTDQKAGTIHFAENQSLYTPLCQCRNPYFKVDLTIQQSYGYHFELVCEELECSSDSHCVQKIRNGLQVEFRYYCVCPSDTKCPYPKRSGFTNSCIF